MLTCQIFSENLFLNLFLFPHASQACEGLVVAGKFIYQHAVRNEKSAQKWSNLKTWLTFAWLWMLGFESICYQDMHDLHVVQIRSLNFIEPLDHMHHSPRAERRWLADAWLASIGLVACWNGRDLRCTTGMGLSAARPDSGDLCGGKHASYLTIRRHPPCKCDSVG